MTEPGGEASPAVVPLFPLPDLVFFPGMVLPLRVFEPRYLELVQQGKTEEFHTQFCCWDVLILEDIQGFSSRPELQHELLQLVYVFTKNNRQLILTSASSVNAMAGAFGQTNYAATKAATQGFTRSLCREVGKHGITVNCVAPGFIESEMTASMPQEIIDAGIRMIPVGRIGTPEDMGHAYLFLSSKEAGFVSGITLHANGGAYPI